MYMSKNRKTQILQYLLTKKKTQLFLILLQTITQLQSLIRPVQRNIKHPGFGLAALKPPNCLIHRV